MVCTIRDITERKREQIAMREQRDFLQLVIDSVPDLIVVKNRVGRFQLVNNLAAQIYSSTPADLVNKTDAEANPNHADVAFIREKDDEAFATGQTVYLADEFTLGRHYQTSKIPLINSEGYYDRLLVVGSDITDRKKAEEILQQALEKEKELSELKSRFVSMASHEFRNPLAIILAITDTLSAYRQQLPEEQIEERISKIKVQIGHLKDIMDDVLLLSRMQARRVEFNPVLLHLDALCRSVLDEFESRPDVTQHLVYTCNDALREVRLDRKLMRQIINNLVANAIKYSMGGTTITVNLEYTAETVVFRVRDEGIGIPEADLKHLFEPFHRATNVSNISGTGLGLVITKESVELHGGAISVESQISVGTTFTVSIPITVQEEN